MILYVSQVSRLCTHMFMLKDFVVGDDVLEKLEGSGFEHFVGISNLVSDSHVLIDVLRSFYSRDSGCFKFHGGNLYFSLLDVLSIIGFPIVGTLIAGVKVDASEMCAKHFGNYEGMVKDKGLSLLSLRQIAMSDRPREMRVKATVLFLVGTFLLPDTLGSTVKPIYCECLDDIDHIKDYAWGSAAHALLHDSLSHPGRNTSGCAFSLMIFVFMHIPSLVGDIGYKLPERPTTTFPLIKGWISALDKTSRKGAPQISNDRLATILREELEASSIVWTPYRDLYQLSDDLFPRWYKDQIVVGRLCIYSFHLWTRVLNAIFNGAQQFDMTRASVEQLSEKFQTTKLIVCAKKLQGNSKKNYNEIWADDIKSTIETTKEALLQEQNHQLNTEDEQVFNDHSFEDDLQTEDPAPAMRTPRVSSAENTNREQLRQPIIIYQRMSRRNLGGIAPPNGAEESEPVVPSLSHRLVEEIDQEHEPEMGGTGIGRYEASPRTDTHGNTGAEESEPVGPSPSHCLVEEIDQEQEPEMGGTGIGGHEASPRTDTNGNTLVFRTPRLTRNVQIRERLTYPTDWIHGQKMKQKNVKKNKGNAQRKKPRTKQ